MGVGTVVVVAAVVSLLVSFTVVALAAIAFSVAAVDEAADEEPWIDEGSDREPPEAVDAYTTIPVEATFAADGPTAHLYRYALPEDAVFVRADLTGSDVDLDLRVTFGEDEADEESWRVTADGATSEEYAWIARHDDAEFAREPFMVRVDRYDPDDHEIEDTSYTLRLTVLRAETTGRLAPGESAWGAVSPDTGHRASYEVVLPEGVDAVCVDLVDCRQNLDLAADVRPVLDAAHAASTAFTPLARESLVLERGALRLGDGEQTLQLVVLDRWWNDRVIPFQVRVSEGAETPAEVRRLPRLAPGRNDAERVARSVVALIADDDEGSGVVVGDGRHLLTAAHVVETADGDDDDVVVCVTTDIEREPLELVRGRVIASDDELDVALVEITATLHGDPLPEGWSLPALPLRKDDAPLLLGAPVAACGYPVLHESDERSEITWTEGVVCGFESPAGARLIRFDAEISGGSSGGALLDADGRVVGITIAMHGDTAQFSATGLALAVSEIPADWLERIE